MQIRLTVTSLKPCFAKKQYTILESTRHSLQRELCGVCPAAGLHPSGRQARAAELLLTQNHAMRWQKSLSSAFHMQALQGSSQGIVLRLL